MLVSENIEEIAKSAKEYFELGFPIVPVRGKKPIVEWSRWQDQKQSVDEFDSLPFESADGFGVICGKQCGDGYLAVIDFDVKNVSSSALEKGREALKHLRITRMERTPSGGQHWIYLSVSKPRSISSYHDQCALELLSQGKICIMYPSKNYFKINDNMLTKLSDLEGDFLEALQSVGVKAKMPVRTLNGSQKTKSTVATYRGRDPPCVRAMFSGVKPGERNESILRLTSYLLNRRKLNPKTVWARVCQVNDNYQQPLERSELRNIFQSAHGKGYVFSCGDPLLSKFCVEDDCVVAARNRRNFQWRVENL